MLPVPPAVQDEPLYSTDVAELLPDADGGSNLPKATRPAVWVPVPQANLLFAGKAVTAVHELPSYSSTSFFNAEGGYVEPPAKAAALTKPKPDASSLPTFKFPPLDQPLPFHS